MGRYAVLHVGQEEAVTGANFNHWSYMKDLRYKNHNELVNRTLIYLSSQQLGTFWANATGAVKATTGHFHRFGLKGSSDILGMTKMGRFVGIEIKTGKAVQSKHQKAFQAMVLRNNGMYFIVRSDDDLPVVRSMILLAETDECMG